MNQGRTMNRGRFGNKKMGGRGHSNRKYDTNQPPSSIIRM